MTSFDHELNKKRLIANDIAIANIETSNPVLIGVKAAGEVIPNFTKNTILTSGAIQNWSEYYGGQKKAIIGAALFEGLGTNEEDVEHKIKQGEIIVGNCHDYNCVGSLAGVYSASMPVFIVHDKTHNHTTFCNIYEGSNPRRLNYGIYDEGVHSRLLHIQNDIAPMLHLAITTAGEIELKPLMAKGLRMGDELHSRSAATTLSFAFLLISKLLKSNLTLEQVAKVQEVIGEDQYFFLRIGMAASKAIADSIKGIEYSSIVSAMCFDCQNFNIRVSALGNQWFKANIGNNLDKFYKYSGKIDPEQITVMGGESIINETIGLGGLAQAAAPALQDHQGGTFEILVQNNQAMYNIVHTTSKEFLIPTLNFKGCPTGIDIFKVVETGISPILDIGIPGKHGGQLGAGTAQGPLQVFQDAVDAYLAKYN